MPATLRDLTADGRLLFATRAARMFGYGFLAVVLVLYLARLGLDGAAIGLLLALTLVGDTVISLWLTTHADRIGRRRVLLAGAGLMVAAGLVFATTNLFPLLLVAGTIGVISPSGNEVGPFLAVEQASLSQTVPDARRTAVFAWYNLVGQVGTACGALGAGLFAQALQGAGFSRLDSLRAIVIAYALVGASSRSGSSGCRRRSRCRAPPTSRWPAVWASGARGGSFSGWRPSSRSTRSPAASSCRA